MREPRRTDWFYKFLCVKYKSIVTSVCPTLKEETMFDAYAFLYVGIA